MLLNMYNLNRIKSPFAIGQKEWNDVKDIVTKPAVMITGLRELNLLLLQKKLVTEVSNKSRSACGCCGAQHPLWKCDEFALRSVEI